MVNYCHVNIERLKKIEFVSSKEIKGTDYSDLNSNFAIVLSSLYVVTNKLVSKEGFLNGLKKANMLTPAEFARIERIVQII